MLIMDLEMKSGLDRATIRFYEKEGLIAPERKENGYRTYSDADLDTLLKVKLLRQLGMSLEKIKDIQQGQGSLTAAAEQQIEILEDKIKGNGRSRDICKEIRDSGSGYDDLDAAYYLSRLHQESERPAAKVIRPFYETVRREYHPVRRYLARMLDYGLLNNFLRFLVIVVFRVRPFGTIWSTVLNFTALFTLVPIQAFLLHRFGTTPGKWVLGLRVESCDGGNLRWQDALDREWNVLKYGLGYGIPLWEEWRLFKSYKNYRDELETEWDDFCEYIFEEWHRKRKAAMAGLVCVIAAIIFINSSDIMKPKYRGDELTVHEFAENYNYYLEILTDNYESYYLLEDGTQNNPPLYYINGEAVEEEPVHLFDYETENGFIRSITYSKHYDNVFYCDPISEECLIAAYAIGMAQSGAFMKETEQWEMQEAKGEIRFKNMTITWSIYDTVNCKNLNGLYIAEENSKESSLSVIFQIIIE